MAIDNFESYARFTSINPNIAQHGLTVEEIKGTQGSPEGNPIHSPMAAPKVAEAQLALGSAGSDKMRLAHPDQPTFNPHEGPKRTLALSRTAQQKLSESSTLSQLEQLVAEGKVGDANTQGHMLNSFKLTKVMGQLLAYKNMLAGGIVAQALSVGKA